MKCKQGMSESLLHNMHSALEEKYLAKCPLCKTQEAEVQKARWGSPEK